MSYKYGKASSGSPLHDETLLEDDIEGDLEEVQCLTSTVPGPGSIKQGRDPTGTAAWKDLMTRMQENLRKPSANVTTTSKRGSKATTAKRSVNPPSKAAMAATRKKASPDAKPTEVVISSGRRDADEKVNMDEKPEVNEKRKGFNFSRLPPEPASAPTTFSFMDGIPRFSKNTNSPSPPKTISQEPPLKKTRLENIGKPTSFVYDNDNEIRRKRVLTPRLIHGNSNVRGPPTNAQAISNQPISRSSSRSCRVSKISCSLVSDTEDAQVAHSKESKPKVPNQASQPKPSQLFPIFMPKSETQMKVPATTTNGVGVFKSQHNFNHVIYDYPEIQDGWNTKDKTVVTLRASPTMQAAPATAVGWDNQQKQKPRECPFYKKIPGTKFTVDAFSYGVIPGIDVYFLSHFHSDHYMGLTKKFSSTVICSSPTGNLVQMKLGVAENCIRKLELNKVYIIQGTEVVLIEANHCPGSVIFLFRLPNGSTILHTGDFRHTPDIFTSPFVKSLGHVSCLYLDTTYCDPRYDFPSQVDTVNQVVMLVQKHVRLRPRTLVVCGAYCIGKERVFFSVAEAINTKVYCIPAKFKMLTALGNSSFNEFMKPDEEGCRVHVMTMGDLNPNFLAQYLNERSTTYNNILAIRPSGWEFSKSGQGFSTKSYAHDTVTIIGIPYSEHSSFSELHDFVKRVKPTKVQPTVNVGNETKRNSMMKFINQWLEEGRNGNNS